MSIAYTPENQMQWAHTLCVLLGAVLFPVLFDIQVMGSEGDYSMELFIMLVVALAASLPLVLYFRRSQSKTVLLMAVCMLGLYAASYKSTIAMYLGVVTVLQYYESSGRLRTPDWKKFLPQKRKLTTPLDALGSKKTMKLDYTDANGDAYAGAWNNQEEHDNPLQQVRDYVLVSWANASKYASFLEVILLARLMGVHVVLVLRGKDKPLSHDYDDYLRFSLGPTITGNEYEQSKVYLAFAGPGSFKLLTPKYNADNPTRPLLEPIMESVPTEGTKSLWMAFLNILHNGKSKTVLKDEKGVIHGSPTDAEQLPRLRNLVYRILSGMEIEDENQQSLSKEYDEQIGEGILEKLTLEFYHHMTMDKIRPWFTRRDTSMPEVDMEIMDSTQSGASEDVIRQLREHAETTEEEVVALHEEITQIKEDKSSMQATHEEELKTVALENEKWQARLRELFKEDMHKLSPEECCEKLREMKAVWVS